jgi:putative ABC transport system permease protein
MIGIAAIIVTFSIGSGAQEKVKKQIMSMGEGAVYIVAGNVIDRGRTRSTLATAPRMRERDLEAIKAQCPSVRFASRGHDSLRTMEHGSNSVRDRVLGVDETMNNIANYKIKDGSFFTQDHLQKRVNVVVLGNTIAEKLFKGANPVGQTIRIDEKPFTVIGVYDPIDFYWGTNDPNSRAYIPFTVADKYFRKEEMVSGDLGFMSLRIKNPEIESETTLRSVRRILRYLHNIKPGDEDDFMIFDQQSLSDTAQQAASTIKLFGLIAASISLLVGGIGVMNIMLVSVKERTKEIGIRLALGATQNIVQRQFLIEAATLSGFGGIMGIVLGIIAQYFVSKATNLPGTIELLPLLISFLITMLVGIFFGYYPARKASLLNPVDALLDK